MSLPPIRDDEDTIISDLMRRVRSLEATQGGGPSIAIVTWTATLMPTVTGEDGAVWKIPPLPGSDTISIDLTESWFYVEADTTSGTYVVDVQAAAGGGPTISWSTIATLTLTTGDNEDFQPVSVTVTTGDLLRLNFTALGVGGEVYTVFLEGDLV